jgi:hypothetical protein
VNLTCNNSLSKIIDRLVAPHPLGNGRFVAYLTINGKEVKRTIGAIGVVTLAVAIAQRVEWQKQIQLGTYNAKPVAPPETKPPVTFAAICDSALNFYTTRKR